MSSESRSPLKDPPLRNPGQSLDEEIRDQGDNLVIGPVLFALLMALVAALEWYRYFRPHSPSPVLYSAVAIVASGYAVYRIYRSLPRLRTLRVGRDGEKEVGRSLEELRARGYHVFHDILGKGFNLDHVLIGPGGVFTVETKTHSKPSGDSRVVFDGATIQVGAFASDRDPVVQARAQAGWLKELLAQSTGRQFQVKPVIVYINWYVEQKGPDRRNMWVLNQKALPAFLDHEPTVLSSEDIHLASFHLERFVRTSTKG